MNLRLVLLSLLGLATASHGQSNTPRAATAGPAPYLRVTETRHVDLGDRSIFYKLGEPPALPIQPPAVMAPEAALSLPEKPCEVLFLSATVHDRRVSELRWTFNGRRYSAVSSIDMNLFRGLGGFEIGGMAWLLVMGIGNETSESPDAFARTAARDGWPWRVWHWISDARLPLRAEYILLPAGVTPEPGALAANDALHAYYNANRQALAADFERREKVNAQRAAWLKAHPPVPKDTTVHFWPKKNSRYLRTAKPEGKR